MGDELDDLADRASAAIGLLPDYAAALAETVQKNCEVVAECWSGSNLGYQASVYYEDLQPPPPSATFDPEWGLMTPGFRGSTGQWRKFSKSGVSARCYEGVDSESWTACRTAVVEVRRELEDIRQEALGVIEAANASFDDPHLRTLMDKVQTAAPFYNTVLSAAMRTGEMMSRDSTALSQGFQAAPHQEVWAQAGEMLMVIESARTLNGHLSRSRRHLERLSTQASTHGTQAGTHVFIGHGGSPVWRDLKDFLRDRLELPYEEFNRVSVAGVPNTTRLAAMLDKASFAFLVMTAEDEAADGKQQARMNVVHEVGLFQGRLGFERAIILLEEGCEEFSNIQGLGQIRFPSGDLPAKFEDIRMVLEREGVIGDGQS